MEGAKELESETIRLDIYFERDDAVVEIMREACRLRDELHSVKKECDLIRKQYAENPNKFGVLEKWSALLFVLGSKKDRWEAFRMRHKALFEEKKNVTGNADQCDRRARQKYLTSGNIFYFPNVAEHENAGW